MASLDQTTFEPVLKVLYPDEAIKNLVYQTNPFLALIPKEETFYGESSKEPIQIGVSQNRAATFSNANQFNTTAVLKAFLVTRVLNYSMASIANETIEASENDKGAFVSAVKIAVDGALRALTNSQATQMFRSGTGSVAQIAATATVNSSTVYVQLANPADIVQIEEYMSIAFSNTDGGAVESGTAYVVKVNRTAGSFLCSATPGGSPAALTSLVSSVAAGDYIYQNAGDRALTITGLQGWLKGVAAAGTLFGVDCTQDSRLAGLLYDGTALSIEEALINAASLVAREGGTADHVFMNFASYAALVKEVSSKQQYLQYTNTAVDEPGVTIGFNTLILTGPTGAMKIIPDRNCPANRAFILQMDTWKLKSLGALVRIFKRDGLEMLRDPSADAVQLRCFSYANMSCRAPGWNAQVLLGA